MGGEWTPDPTHEEGSGEKPCQEVSWVLECALGLMMERTSLHQVMLQPTSVWILLMTGSEYMVNIQVVILNEGSRSIQTCKSIYRHMNWQYSACTLLNWTLLMVSARVEYSSLLGANTCTDNLVPWCFRVHVIACIEKVNFYSLSCRWAPSLEVLQLKPTIPTKDVSRCAIWERAGDSSEASSLRGALQTSVHRKGWRVQTNHTEGIQVR